MRSIIEVLLLSKWLSLVLKGMYLSKFKNDSSLQRFRWTFIKDDLWRQKSCQIGFAKTTNWLHQALHLSILLSLVLKEMYLSELEDFSNDFDVINEKQFLKISNWLGRISLHGKFVFLVLKWVLWNLKSTDT